MRAELAQKRDTLSALLVQHNPAIVAGREARMIIEKANFEVNRLERALNVMEDDA